MIIVALWRTFSTPRRSNFANSHELEIPRLNPDCFGWSNTRSISIALVMIRRVRRMWERLIWKTIEKREDCMQNYENSKENNKSRKLPLIWERHSWNMEPINKAFKKRKKKEISNTAQCESCRKWWWFSQEQWLQQESTATRDQRQNPYDLNTTSYFYTIEYEFYSDPITSRKQEKNK